MIPALLLIPVIGGLAAFLYRSLTWQRLALLGASGGHLAVVFRLWMEKPEPITSEWLGLDAVGQLFLTITSVLFFVACIHGSGKMREENGLRNALYVGCLLLFLAAITLATLSQHMGLLWISVEATTLATAPLIYFHRTARSLEAAWKYLLICSVGIALALLGTFFLAVSATVADRVALDIPALVARAGDLDPIWLKAAFIFLVIGYGTKMGLAPMHTWLPDAHSEAPSAVSALLSATLLNGAFLAILRTLSVMNSAGLSDFCAPILVLFGLASMGLAGAFILGQTDYKRLLAYSSVEHMGILALGAGLGGGALWAALLHTVNHSLAKGWLFLTAGNILGRTKTKSALEATGLQRRMPITAALWLGGVFAICGFPPFGTFFSEFTLLRAAFAGGNFIAGSLYLAFLALVFVGMFSVALRMVMGEQNDAVTPEPEPAISWLPPLALAAFSLALGLAIPQQLWEVLDAAAKLIDPSFAGLGRSGL